jgi:hypothetical protein
MRRLVDVVLGLRQLDGYAVTWTQADRESYKKSHVCAGKRRSLGVDIRPWLMFQAHTPSTMGAAHPLQFDPLIRTVATVQLPVPTSSRLSPLLHGSVRIAVHAVGHLGLQTSHTATPPAPATPC